MNWLADLNAKWVLVLVGTLMLVLATCRLSARDRDSTTEWLIENVQVVLSVVVVVFLIIRIFVFQAYFIPSMSMEPTLQGPPEHPVGDRLIANKAIYFLSRPQRKDIVVFYAPPAASPPTDDHPRGKEFIKRTIGLPGETVEVVPPRLLVDGKMALNLAVEGNPSGLFPGDQVPEVSADGAVATLHLSDGDELRVVAAPDPDVRVDRQQVLVNGRPEWTDTLGQIETGDALVEYGADAGVKGKMYEVAGKPRLAVVSGKRLEYSPGHVLINGKPIHEPYINEAPNYGMSPIKLGADEYFMMGDNRNNSEDSHRWGPLTGDRVIGRAEVIFWPLDRLRVIDPWLLIAMAVFMALYQLASRLLARRQ
ncbi:MAG: signal peptidase I [Actinomycetota bacterium]